MTQLETYRHSRKKSVYANDCNFTGHNYECGLLLWLNFCPSKFFRKWVMHAKLQTKWTAGNRTLWLSRVMWSDIGIFCPTFSGTWAWMAVEKVAVSTAYIEKVALVIPRRGSNGTMTPLVPFPDHRDIRGHRSIFPSHLPAASKTNIHETRISLLRTWAFLPPRHGTSPSKTSSLSRFPSPRRFFYDLFYHSPHLPAISPLLHLPLFVPQSLPLAPFIHILPLLHFKVASSNSCKRQMYASPDCFEPSST